MISISVNLLLVVAARQLETFISLVLPFFHHITEINNENIKP